MSPHDGLEALRLQRGVGGEAGQDVRQQVVDGVPRAVAQLVEEQLRQRLPGSPSGVFHRGNPGLPPVGYFAHPVYCIAGAEAKTEVKGETSQPLQGFSGVFMGWGYWDLGFKDQGQWDSARSVPAPCPSARAEACDEAYRKRTGIVTESVQES